MFLLYTHNDLDGVGCGIAARIAFGDKVEIRYNSVGSLNIQVERFLEKANKKRHLFITDLSVDEANAQGLDEFAGCGGKINLIDHHKTALHLNEHTWGSVQVEHDDGRLASATSLFYEHLTKHGWLTTTPALDEFVELVRQYDTWEWERHDELRAKRLNDLFYMVSIEEFEEKMVERLQHETQFSFDEFEEKILDMEEEKIERYVRRKKREIVQSNIHSHCAGVVHAENYHSELGNELGKEFPHLDYIAILNVGGKKISLRTIHEAVDVSEIAAHFGGGGHAKAAGCPMTEEAYTLFVAKTFPMEPIRVDAHKNRYNLKHSIYGSLYENRKQQEIFIFMAGEGWEVQVDGHELADHFITFEDAERFVKREFAAWLAKDEVYVSYLMEHLVESRRRSLVLA
ncbi:DHH family phosphoesterase [Paenibacillus xerothermodurans]|uniref:Oligoribonuclease n=1 Tax=Paenibacillus xerothermodurans TaxID=1977292 RepID=A0A2W1NDL7_PAEXE|nr:oligoribonuclease [Paenibacillus xerothermodurans]PZE22799.1 oligoribonuclease [Paenibacillus xerothermodurans]